MSGVWSWDLHFDRDLLGSPDVYPDVGTLARVHPPRKNPFKVTSLGPRRSGCGRETGEQPGASLPFDFSYTKGKKCYL